jgi:hypothetical protein
MKCDFQVSYLTCTFASPCLGHKPKARVATFEVYNKKTIKHFVLKWLCLATKYQEV